MKTIHPLSSHTAHLPQRRITQEPEAELGGLHFPLLFSRGIPLLSLPHPPSETQCLLAPKTLPTSKKEKKKLQSWCSESLLCILFSLFFTYLTKSVLVTKQAGAENLCMNMYEHGKVSPILDTQKILSCHRTEKFSRSKLESSWRLYSLNAYCLACASLQDNTELWKLW